MGNVRKIRKSRIHCNLQSRSANMDRQSSSMGPNPLPTDTGRVQAFRDRPIAPVQCTHNPKASAKVIDVRSALILLTLAQATSYGSKVAFARLWKRLAPLIAHYTNDPPFPLTAEDLTQELAVALWEALCRNPPRILKTNGLIAIRGTATAKVRFRQKEIAQRNGLWQQARPICYRGVIRPTKKP